jgi:hypothetical protein
MTQLIALADPDVFLVHGMPMGQGEIAQYGRYPHAWLELGPLVWESRIDEWLPAALYYQLGQIEFRVRYSMRETHRMVEAKGTYGPWPQELLDRDVEIDQIFKELQA